MSISFTTPWMATPQAYWENQVHNFDLPDWHRLWCLAVARAEPNLHAEFGTGQLAQLMSKDKAGRFEAMEPSRLSNVIGQAVSRGLLDGSSCARCLVLPSHAWECGLTGNIRRCATHGEKMSRPRRFKGRTMTESLERADHITAGQDILVSL